MRLRSLVAAVILSAAKDLAAQSPYRNLGFEQGMVGWGAGGSRYEIVVDSAEHVEGSASLRIRSTGPRPASDRPVFGVASASAPSAFALGRTLRLTGWIRTDNIVDGWAGFWVRVDGSAQTLAFDNMNDRGPRGTTPWTRYVVEVPVDSGANRVYIGMLMPGSGTAWFDSLRVEVVGPAMPRKYASAVPFTAPPRPLEDIRRLLTDTELAPLADSGATPAVDDASAAWVRANAKPIRSLGASDFSDLAFLRPLLAGKRVVQLGESGHGVREFDLAKVRLIKYLHEALGYDVIAFESSLFACDLAGRRAAEVTSIALMRSCIFGVWHTSEVLPLFDYIRETQRTAHPLTLTGFDTQTSSMSDRVRSAYLWNVVKSVDTTYARHVYATDSTVDAGMRTVGRPAYSSSERARIVAFYDSLATWLAAHERAIDAALPNEPHAAQFARHAAISMSRYIPQIAAGPGAEGMAIRDRGMADNLDFVLDTLYPGRKVMVWAHNAHIQHRGYGAGLTSTMLAQRGLVRTMGTWVAERRRRELYTIGLFMYRGSAAQNDRAVYPITPADSGSLEAILHRATSKYAFVDLSRAPRAAGTEWMYTSIVAKAWGRSPELIVPRDEYDGILFIDTTWPPDYLRYDR